MKRVKWRGIRHRCRRWRDWQGHRQQQEALASPGWKGPGEEWTFSDQWLDLWKQGHLVEAVAAEGMQALPEPQQDGQGVGWRHKSPPLSPLAIWSTITVGHYSNQLGNTGQGSPRNPAHRASLRRHRAGREGWRKGQWGNPEWPAPPAAHHLPQSLEAE